jgi:hypothetical protein
MNRVRQVSHPARRSQRICEQATPDVNIYTVTIMGGFPAHCPSQWAQLSAMNEVNSQIDARYC